MKSKQKERLGEVDIYKGIAILLIIFGHCFCTFPMDLKGEIGEIQSVIGKFNLNMFFLISGVLFTFKDSWKVFLLKKWKRLVLPWLVFVVLSIVMRMLAGSFTNSHVGSFPHELMLAICTAKYYWFLYALFIMMCFTKAVRNKWVIAGTAGGVLFLYLLGVKPSWNELLMNRFIMYYPWFAAGVLLKAHYRGMSTYLREHIAVSSIIASIVLVVAVVADVLLSEIHFINLIIALMECTSLWVLSVWVSTSVDKEKYLTHFGQYSLQYYLNHLLILLPCFYVGAYVFGISPYLSLTIVFVLGVAISFVMLKVEKKIPLLCTLCGIPKLN